MGGSIVPKCPMSDLPEAPDISNPEKDEFVVNYGFDPDHFAKHAVLYAALCSEISGFAVKHILTPGEKRPNVCLELDFVEPFRAKGKESEYVGCVITIERRPVVTERTCHGMFHPDAAGVSLIKMVSKSSPPPPVTSVLFRFKVCGHWSLQDFVNVVGGTGYSRSAGLPGDLCGCLGMFHFKHQYHFRDVKLHSFSGCRDWMSQVFIRLHYVWYVDWHVTGVKVVVAASENQPTVSENNPHRLQPHPAISMTRDRPPRAACPPIRWETAGFHDIIGKHFVFPEGGHPPGEVIYYQQYDIEEGFVDREVTRVMRAQRGPILHPLPYANYGWAAPTGPRCRIDDPKCTGPVTCPGSYWRRGPRPGQISTVASKDSGSSGTAVSNTSSSAREGQSLGQKGTSQPGSLGNGGANAPKSGPSKTGAAHDGPVCRPVASERPESRGSDRQKATVPPKAASTSGTGAVASSKQTSAPGTSAVGTPKPTAKPASKAVALGNSKTAGHSGLMPSGGKKKMMQRMGIFS